jgi:coenzyme F420-reducing hydrogenase alpha subunit
MDNLKTEALDRAQKALDHAQNLMNEIKDLNKKISALHILVNYKGGAFSPDIVRVNLGNEIYHIKFDIENFQVMAEMEVIWTEEMIQSKMKELQKSLIENL